MIFQITVGASADSNSSRELQKQVIVPEYDIPGNGRIFTPDRRCIILAINFLKENQIPIPFTFLSKNICFSNMLPSHVLMPATLKFGPLWMFLCSTFPFFCYSMECITKHSNPPQSLLSISLVFYS